MSISKRAWTGSALESTPGTAVTTPTRYLPTKATFKGAKKRIYLNEERGNRDMNYGVLDSVRQSNVNMTGPYYNDTSPTHFWASWGLPTTTVMLAGKVWKHTFNLVDPPPTYTIVRSLDAVAYYVPFSTLTAWKLHLVSDGQLLDIDADYIGLYAQKHPSPPSPTFTTVLPFNGFAAQITTQTGLSTDIADIEMHFTQKVSLWYPTNGTADFIQTYTGERQIKLGFTMRFDNDTMYNYWRNNLGDNLTLDVKGTGVANMYQLVLPGTVTGGTYKLSYKGQSTTLAFGALAATIQSQLLALTSIGGTNVTVTGTSPNIAIDFTGGTLATDPALLIPDFSLLTGTGGLPFFGATLLPTWPQELNVVLPNITYDTMDHDMSKDNILMKVTGTTISTPGSSLISGFVQNGISAYTT
jgi:hypothetical protein